MRECPLFSFTVPQPNSTLRKVCGWLVDEQQQNHGSAPHFSVSCVYVCVCVFFVAVSTSKNQSTSERARVRQSCHV